jgi:transposase
LEERVPKSLPLRKLRWLVDAVLKSMSAEFAAVCAHTGRPSIPPERLLRALLLQVFYTIRSERRWVEQLDYNLWYRWFVGLGNRRAGHPSTTDPEGPAVQGRRIHRGQAAL